MGESSVYKIARYTESKDPDSYIEQAELLFIDGELCLRDGRGQDDSRIEGDAAAVISSTPALHEIRVGEEACITCTPEIAAQLPLLLRPVLDDAKDSECWAEVNGAIWVAYPTLDGGHVLIPGRDPGMEPDMSVCWAEAGVDEGESNPLVGETSIGLATPLVAVEYAIYDHGGFGGGSAVQIREFDDFPTVFVDWLLNASVLGELWQGDSAPYLPGHELFVEAALAADGTAGWSSDEDEDDDEEYQDEDEEGDEYEDEDDSNRSAAYLKLHLSKDQIEQVRQRLDRS